MRFLGCGLLANLRLNQSPSHLISNLPGDDLEVVKRHAWRQSLWVHFLAELFNNRSQSLIESSEIGNGILAHLVNPS